MADRVNDVHHPEFLEWLSRFCRSSVSVVFVASSFSSLVFLRVRTMVGHRSRRWCLGTVFTTAVAVVIVAMAANHPVRARSAIAPGVETKVTIGSRCCSIQGQIAGALSLPHTEGSVTSALIHCVASGGRASTLTLLLLRRLSCARSGNGTCTSTTTISSC